MKSELYEWRPVVGYEGLYEVNNLGEVRSLDRVDSMGRLHKGRILKQSLCGNKKYGGYLFVGLSKDNNVTQKYIHRLVAEAFVENTYNLPQVNHKDEDKTNNRAENLEWCTNFENLTYNGRNKRVGDKLRGRASLTRKEVVMFKDGVEIKRFSHPKEAADYLSVSESSIRGTIYGFNHSVKGYVFEYSDGSGKWSDERIRNKKDRINLQKRNKRQNNR